jgi:hypothetical protein
MGGFEIGEAALQRLIGLPSKGRWLLAAAERDGNFFRGRGELLARDIVERAEGLQLGFEIAERGAEFFEAVGHGNDYFVSRNQTWFRRRTLNCRFTGTKFAPGY